MSDADSIEEIVFNAARELADKDKRRKYLDLACEGRPEMRRRIERLLQTSGEADAFFGRNAAFAVRALEPAFGPSAAPQAGPLPPEGGVPVAYGTPPSGGSAGAPGGPLTENSGTRIGHYKLLEQIGEGGFGVVFMAEQEEPVHRRVALKLIKLGMDTKQVLARFEAERQALAMMDHPNIARVLDGGAAESGRPYFVMELVEGVPITEFCDKKQLSTEQRLKLFISVCQAIQSAHQKGIIHRDLKPTNILVSLNADGTGFPKVIDFGIAKATSQKLTEKTLFTSQGMMVGTPAYMSPEQAEASQLDVDTRADIYSLGALLYELLAGSPPFPEERLRSAGYQEMQRIILHEEPDRPSTRLARDLAAKQTEASAKSKIKNLKSEIGQDLDWIVMKCLEKDRRRRYETANGLARDIQRHLSNEPVTARPPSRLYELQKTLRRHKFGFAAAISILLALLAGVIASSLEALRARRAEALAKERLAESEAISKFMAEVFQSSDPAREGRTVTVAESLGAAAKRLETDLAGQPARRAKLQAQLAYTYYCLGLNEESVPLSEKVRDYYLTNLGPDRFETLDTMHGLANSYDRVGRLDEALKIRERVLAGMRRILGPGSPRTVAALESVAISYAETGRTEEAVKLFQQLLSRCLSAKGPNHPDTLTAMGNLAAAQFHAGHLDKALAQWEQAMPLYLQIKGPADPATLVTARNLATCYQQVGRWEEGRKLIEEVVEQDREVFGPSNPETAAAMYQLSSDYLHSGRLHDALQLREQLLNQGGIAKPGDPQGPLLRHGLAECFLQDDRPEEAVKLLEEALLLRRKVRGTQMPTLQKVMASLATSYCALGRNREAIGLLEQLCELEPKDSFVSLKLGALQAWFGPVGDYEVTRDRLVQKAQGTDMSATAELAAKAYSICPSTNKVRLGQALALAQRALELEHGNPWIDLALGMVEYRLGHYAAADRALDAAEQAAGAVRDCQGTARLFRVMSLHRQQHRVEALVLFQQAASEMPPFPKDEDKPFAEIRPISWQTQNLLIWWLAYKETKAQLGPTSDWPSVSGPALALAPRSFSREQLASAIPPRDTNAPASLIDLSAYYNAPLTVGWDSADKQNDLSELPQGLQTFAGVRFDVRGVIQIGNKGPSGPPYPTHLDNIPIGRSCHRLHFLHAASAASHARAGDELGSYIIHYLDGEQIELPIVVGKDLADWWSQPEETNLTFVVAWTGHNPSASSIGRTIRLFKMTWENPRPTVPIRQFDFVSDKLTPGNPFLVALTAEP